MENLTYEQLLPLFKKLANDKNLKGLRKEVGRTLLHDYPNLDIAKYVLKNTLGLSTGFSKDSEIIDIDCELHLQAGQIILDNYANQNNILMVLRSCSSKADELKERAGYMLLDICKKRKHYEDDTNILEAIFSSAPKGLELQMKAGAMLLYSIDLDIPMAKFLIEELPEGSQLQVNAKKRLKDLYESKFGEY